MKRALRNVHAIARMTARTIVQTVILAAALACLAVSGALSEAQKRSTLVVTIDGGIGPATTEYVRRGLETAAERDAPLVVLRINTPGGLDSATRDIVQLILASPVPVAAFVSPSGARAASAGTYILYASHIAAMAPATNLGAATPVRIGGGGQTPGAGKEGEKKEPAADALERKVINDSVAWIRGLAQLYGRNADWAEHAVREGVSLASTEALELGVVEMIASDTNDLLRQADGRTVRIAGAPRTLSIADVEAEAYDADWRLRILAALSNPNIAYVLLVVGVYGLLFEILSPGAMIPGALGAVFLLVGLYALNMLDVSVAGGLLLLLGLAFMAAEALTPTFGIFGIAGLLAFVAGSIFLFREAPPGFALSPWVIASATLVTAGVFAWAATAGFRQLRQPVTSGDAEYENARAVVVDWSGGEGRVRFRGELWSARSGARFDPGDGVRIVRRDGLTFIVEPAPEATINGDLHAV